MPRDGIDEVVSRQQWQYVTGALLLDVSGSTTVQQFLHLVNTHPKNPQQGSKQRLFAFEPWDLEQWEPEKWVPGYALQDPKPSWPDCDWTLAQNEYCRFD